MAVEDVPTSNPLPPPPRRHGQGRGNQSARHENLSNADFRKMVIDTPRRVEETPKERPRKKKDEGEKRPPQRKFRPKPKEEEKREKREEPETPRYRDRAKERREDQNPDYELTAAGLGTLHAVAPPGVVDFRVAETPTISIANSKYLGGDVEHTHLVKGLDYALLNKVRSEIDKPVEEEEDDPEVEEKEKVRVWKDDEPVTFKSATAKLIHQWIVKPPNNSHKLNEMFLPGRTSFLFDMDEDLGHDIPTTLHRSKDDCPPAEEMVTVGIDASVLDRISKIMAYLRLGSSAKLLKKKKKDKGDSKVKGPVVLIEPIDTVAANADEEAAPAVNKQTQEVETATVPTELPPPPPPPPQPVASPPSSPPPPPPPSEISKEEEEAEAAAKLRKEEDDIFEGAGVEYEPTLAVRSPVSEDMEESPRDVGTSSYFGDPTVAPLPQNWPQPQQSGYEGAAMAAFPSEWQQYPSLPPESYVGPWPPEQQFPYPEQYYQNPGSLEVLVQPDKDPRFMSQEEKDRGMSSVFKRDDQRLQQRRELDSREKDPNFISESYSECYPGYQEYNREIVDSDEDEDLTKMDMGSRAKGRLHRWDFETEEEWAKYNEQKEAMPKAAFQFGVKMQDGRKTRKQNKDQKLNNDLHKINQILERKRKENGGGDGDGDGGVGGGGDVIESESHPVKRIRV